MRKNIKQVRLAIFLAAVCEFIGHAQNYSPVALTAASYNQAIVIPATAPQALPNCINVTAGNGSGLGDYTYYEQGFYNRPGLSGGNSGIPAHNTVFTNINNAGMTFLMPPDYTANNELLVDSAHASGTLMFNSATTATNLAILCSGGGGAITVNYTVAHQNLATEAGTLSLLDWTAGGGTVAWGANGNVSSGGIFNGFNSSVVNNNSPFLYATTISVSGASPVVSISFSTPSNSNHANFYAISANLAGSLWTPIQLNQGSFNVMGIVPALIPFPLTATMDTGTNLNQINGWMSTFYESNYVRGSSGGLPLSGSTFTSFSQPTHSYQMASYAGNDAILIDTNHQIANIIPEAPTNYSAFAFITAGGNVGGTPMTNICILQHADGVRETNIFLGIDWFSGSFNSSIAFKASGRVNISSRTLDSVNSANTGPPYLFETYFIVNDTASPVTNIVVKYMSAGAVGSTTYILAVSAASGPVAPIIASFPQTANVYLGGMLALIANVSGGTAPFTNQWQIGTNGVWQNLSDGGNIVGSGTATLTITNAAYTNAADYRLVVSNAAGVVATTAATVTVLSYLGDVTSPGDAISDFGDAGTSPGGQGVTCAIDNTMSKYLNFGMKNGSPFTGPVGFVVTPAMGPSVVCGLRFYTGNDSVERDPADYFLEGSSNGGASYTFISSNALTLPAARNNSGIVSPINQALQQVLFFNTASFTSYRLTFHNVKTNTIANSLQIGEVEFLGGPLITNGETIADQAFNAYNQAFLVQANGQTFYKDSLTNSTYAYMWGQAIEIQMVEDAYDRTESPVRLQMITNLLSAFLANNNGSDWSWDSWNDDVEWAILPFIRAYQMTGNQTYLYAASNNWYMVWNRGWETTIGGGGIWEEMNSRFSKCALSNDPFIISGCMLYNATGNPDYLAKCQTDYAWVRSNLFYTTNGQVNEGITTNSVISGNTTNFQLQVSDNVYNSGTFVNAANSLYQITGNASYLSDALLAANHVVNNNAIIYNNGRAGTTWQDEFVRGLGCLARDNNLWSIYYPWMAANAAAAWNARRPDLNLTWNDWSTTTILDDSYSLECISCPVLQQVLPTVVFGAPVFLLQPASQMSAVGNAVTLSSLAAGGGAVSYQWYHGNSPVAGATNANLVLLNLKASDAGNYWVQASNSVASTFSQVASFVLGGFLAQDAGSNYVSNSSFGNQNQGYGFGPWVRLAPGGGDFIASPAAFDLWNSTPLAGTTANRAFNVPLAVRETFSVQLRNASLSATNINGFELQDANGNVLFKFFWQGGDSANGHYADATVNNGSAVGFSFNSGNFNTMNFTLTSSTTYSFADATTGRNFNGTLSGAPITQVTFLRVNYGSESLGGYGQDLQINNLSISVAPGSPTSSPISLTGTARGWSMNFGVAPGYNYRVLSATNLTGPWGSLGTLTGPVTGTGTFIDTNLPAVQTFYRTVSP